jgi:hypothetical protein
MDRTRPSGPTRLVHRLARGRRLTGLALASLPPLLGLAAAVAHADDAIYVPGTACRARKADIDKISYTDISVVNESSSAASVVCPLHFMENADGFVPGDVRIMARDRSTSSNITCTLYAFSDTGAGVLFQEPVSSTGTKDPGTGKTLQMLRGIDGAIDIFNTTFESPPQVNFSLRCTLPGASSSTTRSEIVDYRVGVF